MSGLKRTIYLLVLIFLMTGVKGQTIIDLEYCQQKSRENNPLGVGIEQLKTINEYKVKSINSRRLPNIYLNAQATYQSDVMELDLDLPPTIPITFPVPQQDQYKATLEINQLIYDGGAIKKQKELQKTSSNLDIQQVEVDLYKMRESVNQVYFSILILQESNKLIELMHQEVLEKHATVKSGVVNGVVLASNELIIKAEILRLEQKIEEVKISIKNALRILSILVGEEFSENTQFNLPLISFEYNTELNRPEHILLDQQQKKMEAAEALTATQRMPQFFAFSQVGYGRPGLNYLNTEFDSFYLLGLGFKWNIWDWSKVRNERQVLKVQANMILNHKENLNKNLRIALQKEYGEIEKYEKYIEKDIQIIELQSEIVKSASSQLDNGVITSTEYITELNKRTQAELDMETHKIQLVKAQANYLTIKGEETVKTTTIK